MPPKRKATSTLAPDLAVPAKRKVRKTQETPAAEVPKQRRSTRLRGQAPAPSQVTLQSREQSSLPTTRSRRTVARSHVADAAGDNNGDDADELLLTPARKVHPRPVTPTRDSTPRNTATPRSAAPRLVLEAVEIVTPKWLSKVPQKDTGSPAPGSSPRQTQHDHGPHVKAIPEPQTPRRRTPSSPSKRRHLTADESSGAAPYQASPSVLPESNLHPHLTSPSKVPAASTVPPSATPKRKAASHAPLNRLSRILPEHLHSSLDAQKRGMLRSLQSLPQIEVANVDDGDGPPTNQLVYEQLSDLLKGTAQRGEGNSCLVIGPRGSGKTRIVEQAIAALPDKPIVIHLSGHAQHNDRLAIREIARQLASQTGNSFLPDADKDSDEATADLENPFVEAPADVTLTLPPPAHLLALISVIPTLSHPTVVVIDAFDLFATHARQSLLYCLLDTVQSCRVSKANKGIAVVGVTTRVDTINLLEKRVKSRFSGRMLRTACPSRISYWISLARAALCAPVEEEVDDHWPALWQQSVDTFLGDETVIRTLEETFALSRDVHMLRRILVNTILNLTPATPHLSPARLAASVATQRCPPKFPFLPSLSYPAICLLIASVHAQTSGHDTFTFEMLHECFRDQVRTSQSAPVQVEGGGIGMVRCSREVLVGAFERLISLRVLLAVSAPAAGTMKQFVMYRSALDRADVKRAVETMGQTNLKKWFSKAQ